ncbi:hypothetical protein ANCCEY_05308 [Ancylostoma ceylanicum]|uniref:Uncharacterized protein n=1 Tax=Ancylostoma ceylanicum TaxID=53326 RepID=A0A0D6LUS4_9BILA|nr:hypothetical protein ANCCEY_05308 [Ancylostoma ceylanicum]
MESGLLLRQILKLCHDKRHCSVHGIPADILCSTASIWNLSIVGLDRYWAITSPVTYMSKR